MFTQDLASFVKIKKKKKKNLPQVTSMPELLQTLHFTISSALLQN